MLSFLKNTFFTSPNQKIINKYNLLLDKTNSLEKATSLMSADVTILDINTEDSIIGSPNSNTNISEEKEFIFVTKFREIIFRLRKWSCILVCFNLVFLFLMVVVFE